MLKTLLVAAILQVPAVLMVLLALPELFDGIAIDESFPVPAYIIGQWTLPKATYAQAARALKSAPQVDGEAQIFGSEAAILAGKRPSEERGALENAVAEAPANPRGWMVVSDAYAAGGDRRRAAAALAQALTLAQHEFYLSEPLLARSANLWPWLDHDSRSSAVRITRQLWDVPESRSDLLVLAASPSGSKLIDTSFEADGETSKLVHDWLGSADRDRD